MKRIIILIVLFVQVQSLCNVFLFRHHIVDNVLFLIRKMATNKQVGLFQSNIANTGLGGSDARMATGNSDFNDLQETSQLRGLDGPILPATNNIEDPEIADIIVKIKALSMLFKGLQEAHEIFQSELEEGRVYVTYIAQMEFYEKELDHIVQRLGHYKQEPVSDLKNSCIQHLEHVRSLKKSVYHLVDAKIELISSTTEVLWAKTKIVAGFGALAIFIGLVIYFTK